MNYDTLYICSHSWETWHSALWDQAKRRVVFADHARRWPCIKKGMANSSTNIDPMTSWKNQIMIHLVLALIFVWTRSFKVHPPHGRFSVEGLRLTTTDHVEHLNADPLYGRFLVEALSRTTNHNVEHLGEQPLYGRLLVEALSKTSNHKVGSFFIKK